MRFYNTRDSQACWDELGDIPFVNCWPEPEVAENMDLNNMGDIMLTDEDEDAIFAFILTLSDGYTP